MVNRQVVGAHYGLRDWLAQRITAVIMLVFTLLVLLALLMLPKFDFWHWQALWNLSLMRYAGLLFFCRTALSRMGRRAKHIHGLHQGFRLAADAVCRGHPGADFLWRLGCADSLGQISNGYYDSAV